MDALFKINNLFFNYLNQFFLLILLLYFLFALSACASKEDLIFDSDEDDSPIISFDLSDPRFEHFRSSDGDTDQEDELTEKEQSQEVGQKSEASKKKQTGKSEEDALEPEESKTPKEQEKAEELSETTDSKEGLKKKEEEKETEEEEEYPEEFYEFDKRSEKLWQKFEPNLFANERLVFRISYLGLTAGSVQLKTEPMTEIAGRDAFHFRAHMRSARYYRYIYELDDRLETYIDARNFLPIQYTLIQRESGQDVDDLQLFDSENLQKHFFFKRVKDGNVTEREETHPIPYYVQDSFSSLYFVRGLPLEVGDRYEFPVVTRGRIWIIELDVVKKEQIKIMNEWVDAIRVNAITRYPGVLESRGDIIFWYSADDYKKPLQFRADVKIGSIRGALIEFEPGTKAQVMIEDERE